MKRKQRILLFLSIFLPSFAFFPSANSQEDGLDTIFQRYQGSVVYLICRQGYSSQSIGTGFIIDDEGTVITNAHVVAGARTVTARFLDGTTIDCLKLDVDTDRDLAALKLESSPPSTVFTHVIPLASTQPRPLQTILTIGNPSGLVNSPHAGRVTQLRQSEEVRDLESNRVFQSDFPIIEIDVTTAKGGSGSPVINTQGEAIGVVVAGVDEGRFNLNFAIPVSLVSQLNLSTASPFGRENEWGSPTGNFQDRLSYRTNASTAFRQSGNPSAPVINIRSDNLGFINPQAIGTFVSDSIAWNTMISMNQYQQLAATNRLVHVINTPFRFSLAIPESYQLFEEYVQADQKFHATVISAISGFGVEITARRIDPPESPDGLVNSLTSHGQSYLQNELGLTVAQFENQLPVDPRYRGVRGDPTPRIGVRPSSVRFIRYYENPFFDIGDLVIYEIDRDIFYTFRMQYNVSIPNQPVIPAHFVERAFMAATFSAVPSN